MSLYDLATTPPIHTVIVPPAGALGDPGAPPPPPASPQPTEVKTALTKMAKFIPTETITIYLGAISAAAALQSTVSWLTPANVYWVTALVLTPAIFLLIWAIDRAKLKKPLFADFPVWKLVAAIIGFLIWALAIPGNPYATTDIAKVSVAFIALMVSIVLDLIDQLVETRKAI